MKKITLFLLLVISLQVSAQIRRVALFDFTKPTELNPSITPRTDNGGGLKVSDKVFTNGLANISFVEGSQITGAQIQTGIDEEWNITSYTLRLTYTTQMVFSCTNGSTIDSIRISHDSVIGDLSLNDSDQPGTLDALQGCELWKSEPNSNVSKVVFKNGPNSTEFKQIAVYYKENASTLSASFDIPSGSTLNSFETLRLTYAKKISLTGNSALSVVDSNGNTTALNVTTSGKTATLSLDKAITEKGSYRITIPEGFFKDNDGYVNARQSYGFTIETAKNTFNYTNASPSLGNITKLSDKFSLEFPDEVGYVAPTPLVLFKDGKAKRSVVMSKEGEKVIFSFQNVTDDLTENGTYTLTVPEGSIYNAFKGMDEYELYNKEFTLTYTISGEDPNPNPTPEPSVDSETMKAAKVLLQNTGVGYPATTSEAYLNLKQAVESETTPSDEELMVLIDAYNNETAVNLPEDGKWYKLANVNSKGKTLFVTTDTDGGIALTNDESQGIAFVASIIDNQFALQAQNGKYFFVNGLTEGQGKELTISKFKANGIEAKDVIGTLSIYGYCSTNTEDKELFAYALVNHSTGKLDTDVTAASLHFTEKLSNAFKFVETDKPTDEIVAVKTTFTVTPDVASTNSEVLTLTLSDVDEVTLSENADVYFASTTGARKANATLVPVTGKKNQFTIALGGLTNGSYCLIVPEGTFLYVKDGKTVKNQEYTKAFTIGKNGSGGDENFNYTYNSFFLYNSPGQGIPVKDTFFNDFIIYVRLSSNSGLYADVNKTVKLVNYRNANEVIRTGHLEPCTIDVYNTMALKLVLDSPIAEGDLKAGMYTIILAPGTFGDTNFKKYLDDKTSISPSECSVNADRRLHYTVDNDKATGIDEVTTGSDKSTVIYDLMGRRVQDMSRPGIYIVNGKKVVKK